MKALPLAALAALLLLAGGSQFTATALAAPFLTPSMIRRNGLTDEQYEALWKAGKHPRIEPAAARDWMRRAFRYQNVVEWLDICGETNDFAKLSSVLQADNFRLTETNSWLVSTNRSLSVNCARLADAADFYWQNYTNFLAQAQSYSNRLSVATALAERAQAKIDDEIADLTADAEKYDSYAKRYPLMATIFTALADAARKRAAALQTMSLATP